MKQPELGRKIAELRKAKGFTQEELVEKCNLNVRTLQRIEAGEVTPRSYTLKAIFSALDYDYYEMSNSGTYSLNRFINGAKDILNLKKDTMKKISVLSSTLLIVFLGISMLNFTIDKKHERKLKIQIEQQNNNSIKWFNSGRIDLLMDDYAPTACFYRNGHQSYCGKEEISRAIKQATDANVFQLIDIELISLNYNGNLAVEKSLTTSKLQSGEMLKTINIQEWQNMKGKWLIVNDIDVIVSE